MPGTLKTLTAEAISAVKILEGDGPNITGSIGGLLYDATANGAFSSVGLDPASTFGGDASWNNAEYANFRASYSSSIYGSSGVTPNSYSAQYLIKY